MDHLYSTDAYIFSYTQGSGTFLTQRAMKAKYLEIYFSESHIIYFKTEFN